MRIDVLIVGQGLAGSLLAWEMLRSGYRLLLIDTGEQNASQVAAGLINPVTGQRLVKSADVDVLLPAAMLCYRHLGEQFKQRFFVEMPMLRILRNQHELAYAQQRLNHDDYQAYLKSWMPGTEECSATEFGVLQQVQTGYLRTQLLLARLRDFFLARHSYRQCRLDYGDIVLEPRMRWLDLEPRHIVFCEGYQAVSNPWFGKLPFQLAKGEILACETAAPCPKQILNYGNWLVPLSEHRFKTGATFATEWQDVQPTGAAASSLLSALHSVCPYLEPVGVNEHRAGIRPATLDKQPFIGAHPRFADLHIFNGFGSKGSLSIPWHARNFIESLQQRRPLAGDYHIGRFDDSYFPA